MNIAGKILLLITFTLTSVIAMEMNSKNEEKKVLKIKIKKQNMEKKVEEDKKNQEKDLSNFKKVEK